MNHPAPKQAVNAVSAMLMIRQLEEWEDSVFLSDLELAAALTKYRKYTDMEGKPVDWVARVLEVRRTYPDAVAYSCLASTGRPCYGMRYGSDGPDYLSF